MSAARNTGIDWVFANSASQWLCFVDSDDWIHTEMLERLLNAALESNVPISVCGYAETKGEIPEINADELEPQIRIPEEFFVDHNVNATIPCGKLYRKECFLENRYPIGKIHEDEFITYKILFSCPQIAVVSAPLYFYYTNCNSITNSAWTAKRLDLYTALEEQIQYFAENGFEAAKRAIIRRYLQSVSLMIKGTVNDRRILHILRSKKRLYFKKYASQLETNNDSDAWVLTQVFPIRMKVYWIFRSIKNKIGS